MTQVALGIDLGTGSSKAGLMDSDGRLLAVGRSPHPITHPEPGWSETDPAEWLASVRAAVTDVLQAHPEAEITSIGLSGQMHGVVVVGPDDEPLRPAILWSDRRAQPELATLRTRLGNTLTRLANPIVAGMAGPTVATLERSGFDMEAVSWLLQPKDWLRLRLTGQVATDPSDASATLLWDATSDRWSHDACAAFQVRPSWLPKVRDSDAIAGTTTDEIAQLLGVADGTPVAVGAADTAAALLGAGLAPGETQLSTGTGGQLAVLLNNLVADPSGRTHLFRGAEPERWYAMAAIQNAGIAIDWARGVLGADHDEAEAALATTPPGANGVVFVPYLTGERTPHMNADLTGQWAGLHAGTTRADLLRALFEGVAFALRDGLDALRSAGHRIEGALLAGGGSTSPAWQHLLADTLAIPLTPHDATDASVRGAALLAWRALDTDIPAADGVHHLPTVEPRQNLDHLHTRFQQVVATEVS